MNHPNRWLVLMLILAVMMAAGCNGPATNNSAGNSNGPANANTSPNAGGSPAASMDALTNSISTLLNARSFRARLDATLDGEEMARTVEYVAPDRFRMASEADETVIVGSNAWMRRNNGAWQKLPIDTGQIIAAVRNPQMIEQIRQSAEVRLVGPDTLDAKPMTVYQYTIRNAMGTDLTSHTKAWISTADNLPRRIETETEARGKTSKATITYFDYNADIKIEPPK